MHTTCPLQLRILAHITHSISRALDLDQALGEILRILGEGTEANRIAVALVDEEAGQLCVRASLGLAPGEKSLGMGVSVASRILQSGRPFATSPGGEPRPLESGDLAGLDRGNVALLGAPVLAAGQAVGLVMADRLFGDQAPCGEDVRFLGLVADVVGRFVLLGRQAKAREEGLERENLSLRSKLSQGYQRFSLVGRSEPMVRVQQMIEKVAPTRATVLLQGEPGTGKTLIARMIHELSERARYPFIKVSCAAMPEAMLEPELHGYEKGAFSGAAAPRPGRFEEADKGTVYLDEIGGLSPGVQAKLLRFLQEREFERVGGVRTRRVDVRVIASTNLDLADAVARGAFREDLFYRLNVFPVVSPPLRERREDIPALLNHFLEKLSREFGRRLTFSPRALDSLVKYEWPGNVREMENLVERLSITVEDERIDLGDIPPQFFSAGRPAARVPLDGQGSLKDMEKREVMAALERHNWVQSRAARELGLTLRQIGYRIKKFGLEGTVSERRGREQTAQA